MECAEAKQHFESFVSGRLDPEVRDELQRHVDMCEECSLAVDLIRNRKAAPPPEISDWTIEKIFADGGGAEEPGAAAEAAAAPPPPPPAAMPTRAPDQAPPPVPSGSTLFGPAEYAPLDASAPTAPPPPPAEAMPPAATSDAMGQDAMGQGAMGQDAMPADERPEASSARPSMIPDPVDAPEEWDFEPADAGRDGRPPEEVVQFAEEALGRRRDSAKAKRAAKRGLLWTLGGLAGLGLLGASIWVALSLHSPRGLEVISNRVAPTAGSTEGPDAAAPIEGSTATVTPDGAAAPDTSAAAQAPPAPGQGAPLAASTPGSQPVPGPSKPSAAPKPSARNTPPPPGAAGTSGSGVVMHTTKIPPKSAPKRDDDDMWPTDDPIPTPTIRRLPPVKQAPVAPSTPSETMPMTKGTTPSANPAPPESVAAAPVRPLDRLHAETEKAAQDANLNALRQLRGTWRNFLRSSVGVGPDRTRAKREYADCLWAIQTLSGRVEDQREALAAYRDFILSAPAGGADSRSAARLRMLEDSLAEHR